MSALSSLFKNFHDAVLTKDASAVVPDIKANKRISPEKQMAIYIDGYRIRLTQAIRSDYPALLSLLGEKTFDALAHEYIESNAPSHFSLDRYPHRFAAFIRKYAKDDFAAEVAILEGSIAEVFMLEESPPLDAAAFASLTPEAFGAAKLLPRAASHLLAFEYPVHDWLNVQRAGQAADRPSPTKTYLYVYRHQNEVQRAPVSEAAYILLAQFNKGLSVADAFLYIETNHPQHSEEIAANLQAWFSEWVAKGFFRQSL